MIGPETCEKGDVQAEAALLMETQLHKQKVKPADQHNTEQQGGEAPTVPETVGNFLPCFIKHPMI